MSAVHYPAHWTSQKLKYVASLRSGEGITSDDISDAGEYPVYGGNGVRGYTSSYTHDGTYPLIGRQGALCGNINYASGKFWASEHAVVVSVRRSHVARWLGEVLRSMNLNQYSQSAAQPGISVEVIENLPIPVPPEQEQEAIAAFLDRETARIDGLIAEKKRMLALLEEKCAALISRFVTRGLDPNAPLKPFGQEWLGEIPEHWEVRTLKRASSRIDTGTTPAASFMDGSLPSDFTWFTPSDFEHGGVIAESNRKIPQEAVDEGEAKVFPSHSLMVIGIGATLGKVASSRSTFSANQQINVITPLESVRWDYLLYVLQGYEHVFRAHANSATLPILNQERLGVIRVPVPPWAEQDAIVTRLNESRAEYAEVSQLLGSSISLLQERRAALISAAVNGQVPLEGMTG